MNEEVPLSEKPPSQVRNPEASHNAARLVCFPRRGLWSVISSHTTYILLKDSSPVCRDSLCS